MSVFRSSPLSRNRSRILASVAVLALATAGMVGEGAMRAPHSAQAADISPSATQQQIIPSFAPLIAHVKPAVVSVRVKIVDPGQASNQFDNLPPEIQKYFRRFGEPKGSPANPRSIIGEGSGFFISSDGYIVTNNHVVQNAKSVTVTMDDGKVLDAKVVGTDPKTDLALLKVEGPGNYPYVTLSKEKPHIGDCRGDRQSVRPRRHGDGRHHFGRGAQHRRRSVRPLPADRCADQQGQFRRACIQ